jgi:hypothetical protein
MIEFLCPNEHKIRCPDEKAGRQAKCPKCGVSFRIPTLDELTIGASTLANSPAAEEVADAAVSPNGSGLRPAAAVHSPAAAASANERQIEFLCPNGHHLHGPATLQGRAGECPECGSRFRIPVIDEPEDAEPLMEPQLAGDGDIPLEDEISLSSGVRTAHGQADDAEPLEFLQVLDSPHGGAGPSVVRGMSLLAGDGAAGPHPLATLFIELWAARDESSRVEVHLESGSVIVPDGYVKSHSMNDYAVLVTKDPDGRSTATIVPWKSIARIILRALKEVPGEVVR